LLAYAKDNPIDKKIIDRIMLILESESLSEDLKMQLCVILYQQEETKKFHAIAVNPKFRSAVMEV
jgi:hypothetical protein